MGTKAVVEVVSKAPEMPARASEEFAAEWNRIVAEMTAAKTLTSECGATIEIHVTNLLRMRAADRHIAEHGAIVPAPRTGLPVENPNLRVSNAAGRVVLRTARELGLTPASRKQVRTGQHAWEQPAIRRWPDGKEIL